MFQFLVVHSYAHDERDPAIETHVQNPQAIFNLPQRLLVPLFQRPYVWSEELQWKPLWLDVERVAEKVLHHDHNARHFLGAVVLQQEATATGTLMARTIIDGQQRLTTLQLLFDAIGEEITRLGLTNTARRIADLVENPEHQRRKPEDRYKVWPTNRDRDAFASVMATPLPDHQVLAHANEKIVRAHEFFSLQARIWLSARPDQVEERAGVLVDTVATRLQMVVIDLRADEDAQEIFETLNARGTPLTAADLIKNLVFQRLNAAPEASERAYHQYWAQFETPFWEKEVSSGRVLWSRSSLFLTQWLTSQTQEDILAREVFASFKRHLDDSHVAVTVTLEHIRACADIYQQLLVGSQDHHKPLSLLERFTYRAAAMQSEIVKPLVIWLTDPTMPQVPESELAIGLNALESWLVRRMLVREQSQGTNRFLIDLLREIAQVSRDEVGTRIAEILAEQTSGVSYWPEDDAVRRSLEGLPVYRRLSRTRLRIVLEAIEDHRRGFTGPNAKGEQPVVRDECTIEHVMPQKWGQHWPLPSDVTATDREAVIHTLGNLTLVSKALNPSMSNAAWAGKQGKRAALATHSSIKLTADAILRADESDLGWDETLIEERTQTLIDDILVVWPVPTDHTNGGRHGSAGLADPNIHDLLRAGLLTAGQVLATSHSGFAGAVAVVTPDGLLEVDGRFYETPSGAGKAATKRRAVNGWWFWRLDSPDGPRLRELRQQYAPEPPVEVE